MMLAHRLIALTLHWHCLSHVSMKGPGLGFPPVVSAGEHWHAPLNEHMLAYSLRRDPTFPFFCCDNTAVGGKYGKGVPRKNVHGWMGIDDKVARIHEVYL